MNEVAWVVEVGTSVSEAAPDGREESKVLAYKDHSDHKLHKPTNFRSAPGSSDALDICKVDNLLFMQVFLIG